MHTTVYILNNGQLHRYDQLNLRMSNSGRFLGSFSFSSSFRQHKFHYFLGTLGSKSLSGPFDLEISERICPLCDSASAIKKSRHSCFSSMKPIHSAARPYVAPETTWWCTLLLF